MSRVRGHVETIIGAFLYEPNNLFEETWQIRTADDDTLIAFTNLHRFPNSPSVTTLWHGLAGSADSNYIIEMARSLDQRGLAYVRVNHRGAGASRKISKGIYNSTRWPDYADVANAVEKRAPQMKKIILGYSMSANILLNWLGKMSDKSAGKAHVDLAIAVAAPLSLKDAAMKLDHGFGRVYCTVFMMEFTKVAKDYHLMEKYGPVTPLTTIYEFDDRITSKLAGLKNAEEYYDVASSYERLGNIQVPHVVLTAENDPISDLSFYKTAHWSPMAKVVIEKTGGHLGFFDDSFPIPKRTLEDKVGEWIWGDQKFD